MERSNQSQRSNVREQRCVIILTIACQNIYHKSKSSANQENLPPWLNFDVDSLTISSTRTPNVERLSIYDLEITANDGANQVSEFWHLIVVPSELDLDGESLPVAETLDTGVAESLIEGGDDNDLLYGTEHSDRLIGGDGADIIVGGLGVGDVDVRIIDTQDNTLAILSGVNENSISADNFISL